jgi:hypothetical protein
MKTFSLTYAKRIPVSARAVALAFSLAAITLVACSSEDSDPTATSMPEPTKAPTATQAPDPTAPPEPTSTPLTPTEVPAPTEVPTEVPTQAPAPTAVPTAVPTATPDPYVILTLLVTGQVDPNRFPTVAPGGNELLARGFADGPPNPPHDVSDVRITTKSNKCLTCHEGGFASGGTVATGIPLSHYTDQYTMDVSNDLDPRRYVCTSCHVPQVIDSPPYAE